MSRLLDIQQRIQDTNALIKQTERTVSGSSGSPSVLANLRSLEKRRQMLEQDFFEIADRTICVCGHRWRYHVGGSDYCVMTMCPCRKFNERKPLSSSGGGTADGER